MRKVKWSVAAIAVGSIAACGGGGDDDVISSGHTYTPGVYMPSAQYRNTKVNASRRVRAPPIDLARL